MKEYVLGFAFSHIGEKKYVTLIEKCKPDWQKGKYNGVGGKIEPGEQSLHAMIREFSEEADLYIADWKEFCQLTDGTHYCVYCFYSTIHGIPKSNTEEQVVSFDVNQLPGNVIPNLRWLIPMAESFDKGERAKMFIVKEIYENI